ncbi:peptidase M10 [Haloferula helveola]|uniref:Peptidase M10 n=1 Tax=Haloferula helveola TaxID=490095 RepID=A0ABM7RLC6_9BACT|nr:peptidase M10 [Haloferula helveola]
MFTQHILIASLLAILQVPSVAEPVAARDKSRGVVLLERDPAELLKLNQRAAPRNSKRSALFPPDPGGMRGGDSGWLIPLTVFETETGEDTDLFKPLPASLQTIEAFMASLETSVIVERPNGEPILGGLAELNEGKGEGKPVEVTYYHVEEDIALNELEAVLYYQQATAAFRGQEDAFEDTFLSADPAGSSVVQTPLRAATEEGRVVRWTPGSTLTYCVLRWTFGDDQAKYEQICENMKSAAADWSAVCNIQFEHRKEFDEVPRSQTFPKDAEGERAVLFVVAQQEIGSTIARAFFPNDPWYRRMLLIDPDEYYTTKINKIGIIRHELGHVLGCRHEHISPDAPAWISEFCTLESAQNSKPITKFDRASVMHYPCVALLEDGPPD